MILASPVYFTASTPKKYKKTENNTPRFKYVYGNSDGHYNVKTGVFTAPVKGLYHFHLSFMVRKDPTNTNVYCFLSATNVNGETYLISTAGTQTTDTYKSTSASMYYELEKGQKFYPYCVNWERVVAVSEATLTGALIHPS